MEAAVKRALATNVFKPTGSGGGGCISKGSSYFTDKGTVFVKSNHKPGAKDMFQGEKVGLDAITATGSIRCPKAISVVMIDDSNPSAGLVMENLEMSYSKGSTQAKLGEQLANMHLYNQKLLDKKGTEDCGCMRKTEEKEIDFQRPVTKFGFYVPTSCGFVSQENNWRDDWATFYVEEKLQPNINILNEKKPDKQLNELWPICRVKILETLGKLEKVVPALLHGDLWSGNIASVDGEPVIFDPASFYGHSEYDFGIARMFGGFTSDFFKAYHKVIPKAPGFEQRLDSYELYHHINHCPLFTLFIGYISAVATGVPLWISCEELQTAEPHYRPWLPGYCPRFSRANKLYSTWHC
ncbi:Fructosamine-3-kinase [Orchesella cincta]|uniref:protein-ribulosamine 3-kinase n=1 Tax=Orchesella cincta TaxID=48709 RepID=A0A1D2NJD7_ORCCI|nr:Fructosamine-3-kinase [Orchesella cincta]